MKNLWQDIESEIKKLSPEMFEKLNPGVDDSDIELLEKTIGAKLPQDFIDFFRIHNGQDEVGGGLIEGEELLSFERIISEWNIWKELYDSNTFCDTEGKAEESDADPGIKPIWWNPLWIPFTYDGSGNHYCIDLDPDEGGHYGQVIRMWHDDAERPLIADSFRDFVNEFAQGLKAGEYRFEEYTGIVRID
jgi:cell wall assembly regulator SMI1